MSTILNCTVRSVQVTRKLKKYLTQVSIFSRLTLINIKINKNLFSDEGNQALQEFLCSRNPRQQHSCSLESYLIKPIQRILKYPLLLQQLRNLTDPQSDQHLHLVGKYL